MGISLVNDADRVVAELVFKGVNQSIYKNVQNDIANCNSTKFALDLQRLVIKIAWIVSEITLSQNFDEGNYNSAIKFLCKKVLKNNRLYNDLDAFAVNSNTNDDKRASKKAGSNEVSIANGIDLYNALIMQLSKTFKIAALERLCLALPKVSEKKTAPAKPIETPKENSSKTEQPKKQEKVAPEAAQPKKQEKAAPEAAQPKKQEKVAPEAAQPKKQEKVAPEAAQPKKQEKVAPEAAQPKKQEKAAPEAAQPKKQEKAAPVVAQPKKQEKAAPEVAQPKKQENSSTKASNDPVKKAVSPKTSSHNDKSKASFVDDAVGTFTAELMRGYGWYEKSLSRKDYFQCLLDVNFEGKGKFELKSSQVLINSLKVDNFEINKLIKSTVITVKPGRNDLDIEVDRQGMRAFLANKGSDNINRFPTQISVTVIAMVKSGLTKTKKLPCDISGIF